MYLFVLGRRIRSTHFLTKTCIPEPCLCPRVFLRFLRLLTRPRRQNDGKRTAKCILKKIPLKVPTSPAAGRYLRSYAYYCYGVLWLSISTYSHTQVMCVCVCVWTKKNRPNGSLIYASSFYSIILLFFFLHDIPLYVVADNRRAHRTPDTGSAHQLVSGGWPITLTTRNAV